MAAGVPLLGGLLGTRKCKMIDGNYVEIRSCVKDCAALDASSSCSAPPVPSYSWSVSVTPSLTPLCMVINAVSFH